jgi:hypothetical protein
MNTRILLLAISIVALSSCSSVYKSGQTPDDVYYSPAPARVQADADSYVDVRQPKAGTNYQSYEQYQDNYRDDRFLRMSVGNPYYMNAYNTYGGFDWRYNSFYDGFNYGFSSPWNNYFAWNNYYNPYAPGLYLGYGSFYGGGYYGGGYYAGGGGYYGGGGVKTGTYTVPPRPRVFNVNSYTNSSRPAGSRTYTNSNYYNNNNRYNNTNGNRSSNNNSYYNNSNNNARSYTPSNSNSNSSSNNTYTPSRSYTPSSGGGGGSSSSGGGGGSVSRPSRGN